MLKSLVNLRGRWLTRVLLLPAGISFVGLAFTSLSAADKSGMPDLSQVEQTCLPTSAANLLIWFGRHGYPKLIPDGATADERDLRVVHSIMQDTDARFDWGTRMDAITGGIGKYIRASGYEADVEYRGLDGAGPAFGQDWLDENDAANKGFILVLAYCHWNPETQVLTPALTGGHAVTLVSASRDTLLVHDPAHEDDETGRKILTPSLISSGVWLDASGARPVAGLLFLSGSLLQSPPNTKVLLLGAVCVTMHPQDDGKISSSSLGARSSGSLGNAQAGAASKSTAAWWSELYHAFF